MSQDVIHVSRLPFFTYSCTWNFFVSSWKEVDYICFHVSINCQSRVEGTLTAVAPGAFAPGAVVVAPLANVAALAARTLQRTILPLERPDVGVALFSVEEVVNIGKHWHG